MIRNTISTLLFVATILSLVMGILSYIPTTAWPAPMTPIMSKAGFPLPGYRIDFGFGDRLYVLQASRGRACLYQVVPFNQFRPTSTETFPIWVKVTPRFSILLAVAVLAIYPVIVFIRGPLRRWRRSRTGLCLKCGYDLTGNTTGVCSECGTEIQP